MAERPSERKRGLPAIHFGREQRLAGKYGRPSVNAMIYTVGGLLLLLVAYYFYYQHRLEKARQDILSQQRAAKAIIGAEWTPLRDGLEQFILSERGAFAGDLIDPQAKGWDFRNLPGIYLRVRLEDTKDVKSLREAAQHSVKDGFTGCLLKNVDSHFDTDASALEEKPWNLKRGYQAATVLDEAWGNDVKSADDDLRLRYFGRAYDKAKENDLPVVVDIIKRAQFFLFVLDETNPGITNPDGGAPSISDLGAIKHPVRVHLVDLKAKKLLMRLRREPDAQLRLVSGPGNMNAEFKESMARQANNCALANEVWSELSRK